MRVPSSEFYNTDFLRLILRGERRKSYDPGPLLERLSFVPL